MLVFLLQAPLMLAASYMAVTSPCYVDATDFTLQRLSLRRYAMRYHASTLLSASTLAMFMPRLLVSMPSLLLCRIISLYACHERVLRAYAICRHCYAAAAIFADFSRYADVYSVTLC